MMMCGLLFIVDFFLFFFFLVSSSDASKTFLAEGLKKK